MAGLLPLLFFANSRTRVNDPSLLVPFLTICVKVATPLADLLVSLEQRKENKISHRKKKSIDCWLGDAKTRFESGSSWPSHVWETDCQVRSVRGAIKKKVVQWLFLNLTKNSWFLHWILALCPWNFGGVGVEPQILAGETLVVSQRFLRKIELTIESTWFQKRLVWRGDF